MEEFTVVGYNYGIAPDGGIKWFEVGEVYPFLSVKSQGGWETGCQDYGHQTLENVRCVAGSKGSPQCCGEWLFETLLTREELETKALDMFAKADANERTTGFPIINEDTQSVKLCHQNNKLPSGWLHCRATSPSRASI